MTPSASCAAMVKELYPIAAQRAGDDGLARTVGELAPRVHDFSQFLVNVLGVDDVGLTSPTESPTIPPATACAC